MDRSRQKAGFTLTELLVSVAVIMVLVGIAVPTARHLRDAFESPQNIKGLIGAALSNARAMAVRDGRYVGVRFQRAYDPQNAGNPLMWPQYMVFITQDEAIGAYGFRALENRRPLRLPAGIGVMDMTVVNRVYVSPGNVNIPDDNIDIDTEIDDAYELADATTFSIVFSRAGKLVTHEVWVRNRDGYPDSASGTAKVSDDDIFNKKDKIEDLVNPRGMFYQDDYFVTPWGQYPVKMGYGPEMSRNVFYIYDTNVLAKTKAASRWTDYLASVEAEAAYISPYTGEIINK